MNNSILLWCVIAFLTTGTVSSQNKLIRYFDRYEMAIYVDGKLTDQSLVTTNCKMEYSYKTKDFKFKWNVGPNGLTRFMIFSHTETRDGENIVTMYDLPGKPASLFVVKDSIFQRNKIEFVQESQLESGHKETFVYRFYDTLN